MEQILPLIEVNVLGGVGFALFAVIVGTRLVDVGVRDYICILTIAILGAANIIERWFTDGSFITSCLIGFSIGFLADDVYINLKSTMPAFIKDVLSDTLDSLKDKITKFFRG